MALAQNRIFTIKDIYNLQFFDKENQLFLGDAEMGVPSYKSDHQLIQLFIEKLQIILI